ncbi:hypothetical protein UMM65_17570 [Aureibaculum sp. 2210JD6-5]|nr:hypothetical protein [Aureibaculum sp. 2210JD6-5]MDY7397055.1 hypothetical protein [Aureibaculum sp. 2210JD6-5]
MDGNQTDKGALVASQSFGLIRMIKSFIGYLLNQYQMEIQVYRPINRD